MTKKLYFLILILLLGLISCGEDGTPDTNREVTFNTIMPLGASRVAGNRPSYESYRYELWKKLVDDGWDFDFIGTVNDRASYPSFSGKEFDVDHEGRGGWTSGQILAGIEGWLAETGAPDIVLFSSPGGNDALQGLSFDKALENINDIIDIIQTSNPNVTIIIEKMAPGQSFFTPDQIADYFDQIREDIENLAAEQTTSSSKVITVDMATGFMDSFLADLVHYNEEGARFVAGRYYDVLVNVLEE
jgi:lysophospholipase L1-like esterase